MPFVRKVNLKRLFMTKIREKKECKLQSHPSISIDERVITFYINNMLNVGSFHLFLPITDAKY